MIKTSDELRVLIDQLFDVAYGVELSYIYAKLQQSSDENIFKEHLSIETKGFKDMLSHKIFDHDNNILTSLQTFKLVENLIRKLNT